MALAGADRAVYERKQRNFFFSLFVHCFSRYIFRRSGLSLVQAAVLAAHDAPVSSVCVSDDFSLVVSGSLDHTVVLWDLNRLRFIRSVSTPGPVQHLAVSRSQEMIFFLSCVLNF